MQSYRSKLNGSIQFRNHHSVSPDHVDKIFDDDHYFSKHLARRSRKNNNSQHTIRKRVNVINLSKRLPPNFFQILKPTSMAKNQQITSSTQMKTPTFNSIIPDKQVPKDKQIRRIIPATNRVRKKNDNLHDQRILKNLTQLSKINLLTKNKEIQSTSQNILNQIKNTQQYPFAVEETQRCSQTIQMIHRRIKSHLLPPLDFQRG